MVSVNVEAEGKVTFNLTYDQLLPRKFGVYENVINVKPGQVSVNITVLLYKLQERMVFVCIPMLSYLCLYV